MKVIRREPETDEERMASRIGKRLWELKMAAEEHGLEWELVELFATCDGKAQRLINLGESNER